MKYLLWIFLVLMTCRDCFAQTSVKPKFLHPLQVGDKFPEIPLGTVIGNYTGKTKFSDFRGKLVILDFWDTYCTYCMESMPKLEKLQEEFGDKIQFFIVNTHEDQAEIEKRLILRRRAIPGFKLPHLPSIVNAKNLQELFPIIKRMPHHIWIDQNGIIRASGSSFNANREDIQNFLNGKPVVFVKNSNTNGDESKPLRMPFTPDAAGKQMGSYISSFNYDYEPVCSMTERKDSGSLAFRRTILNCPVTALYFQVFRERMNKQRGKLILGTMDTYNPSQFIDLQVEDTSKYTEDFIPTTSLSFTASGLIKSAFCYEQLTALGLDESTRSRYMLDDLNRYFGELYGTKGSLEKVGKPCYLLVRTSGSDKISTANENYQPDTLMQDGKRMIVWHGAFIHLIIQDAIRNSAFAASFINRKNDHDPVFFFDETGFGQLKNIEIVLPDPSRINTLDDLRKALQPYDLDIIRADREIEYLTIRDKKADN